MATKISDSSQATAIAIINKAKDISIKKIQGKKPVYLFVETSKNRSDARDELSKDLKKAKLTITEKVSPKSSEAATYINGNVVIVYKSKKGGMSETTLNASITELFPAIAFENNISEKLNENKFYAAIQKAYDKSSKIFLSNDSVAGAKFINDAINSSKFKEKINNAKGILKYIKEQNDGKKIKQVYWGYRAKPSGVSSNHAGDIFIEYTDKEKLGVSIKAGGANTREPKLNTYVRKTILTAFNDASTYEKWQKESYEKFYTKVPNIPKYNMYGKSEMVSSVADLESDDPTYYNELYDEQLDWLRGKMIDYFNADCNATKDWLLEYVAHEDANVPTVVVKAVNDDWEIVDDDDIVKECVQRSKKGCAGVNVSKGTGKQSIIMTLTCNSHPTHLDFSIRTNKSGIGHKLGQFINLAFKFNGVIK
tara:strand:+ start:42 stop:1310 length:1269 start_codon:yes stop_codon:yes gene_type:complete